MFYNRTPPPTSHTHTRISNAALKSPSREYLPKSVPQTKPFETGQSKAYGNVPQFTV